MRTCPWCGRAGEPGRAPDGCVHFVGRVARVGAAGAGPAHGPLAMLATRARRAGSARLRAWADDASGDVRAVLDALGAGDSGWWTTHPGVRAAADEACDALSARDWFVGNPSVLAMLETRALDVLRWLDEHDS
ncbi:MAG: hypothetical protein RLZZ299_2768 [Pseudomonadota bacterium]